MDILIAAPMRREARAIGSAATWVGAGPRAGANLHDRFRAHPPDLLIVAGICGALDPSLAPGDVIVSRSVVSPSADERAADSERVQALHRAVSSAFARDRRSKSVIVARLLTVDSPAFDPPERRTLGLAHDAAGVDMETYTLARAAADHGIPWLAIRAVSDGASMRLSSPIRSWRDEDDDRRVALAIARRPWTWPLTLRLILGTSAALRSLAAAVEVAADALAVDVINTATHNDP